MDLSNQVPLNRKMGVDAKMNGIAAGLFRPRVTHRKSVQKSARTNTVPAFTVQCGCCNEKVVIEYDDGTLDINGVAASIEDWRDILLPLLLFSKDSRGWVDAIKFKTGERYEFDALPEGACFRAALDNEPVQPFVKWIIRRNWMAVPLREEQGRMVLKEKNASSKLYLIGPDDRCEFLGTVVNGLGELGFTG